MSNRIDSQIDDMHALVKEMETHQRRKRMEHIYGPIKTVCQFPPIPIRSLDWCAYFDDRLDLDCPSWVQAAGETEAEALATLLEQAEAHFLEEMDAKYQDNLQQRAGC